MSAIESLVRGYRGDTAWDAFKAACKPAWSNAEERDQYLNHIPNEELAFVLSARMGKAAIDWFVQPIGALDKRSASDVLASGPTGITALKALLMRMPV
jgi:hypothetical protein